MAKKLPTDIDQLIMDLELEAMSDLVDFWSGGSDKLVIAAHEALRLRCEITGESYSEVYDAAHEEAKRIVKASA